MKLSMLVRSVIALVATFFYVSNVFSQEIVLKAKYQDNREVFWKDVFLAGDDAVFYFVDKNKNIAEIKQCTWYFDIYKSRDFHNVLEQKNGNEYYFKLNKELTEKIKDSKRIVFDGDDSVYNFARIRCKGESESGEQFDQMFIIYLNYLPPMPKMEIIDATWISYDEEWDIYDHITVTVRCKTDRTDKYLVLGIPIDLEGGYRLYLDFEDGKDIHTFNMSTSLDLIESLSAINEYGTTYGSTYYNFHKFIKEKDSADDVPVAEESSNRTKCKIHPNPVGKTLYVDSEHKSIKGFTISNASGMIALRENTFKTDINVEHLTAGLYFLAIEFDDNRKEIVKFLKE